MKKAIVFLMFLFSVSFAALPNCCIKDYWVQAKRPAQCVTGCVFDFLSRFELDTTAGWGSCNSATFTWKVYPQTLYYWESYTFTVTPYHDSGVIITEWDQACSTKTGSHYFVYAPGPTDTVLSWCNTKLPVEVEKQNNEPFNDMSSVKVYNIAGQLVYSGKPENATLKRGMYIFKYPFITRKKVVF